MAALGSLMAVAGSLMAAAESLLTAAAAGSCGRVLVAAAVNLHKVDESS